MEFSEVCTGNDYVLLEYMTFKTTNSRRVEIAEIANQSPEIREGFKKLLRPWPHVYLAERRELLLRQAQEIASARQKAS